jgi:hypothetical protein
MGGFFMRVWLRCAFRTPIKLSAAFQVRSRLCAQAAEKASRAVAGISASWAAGG